MPSLLSIIGHSLLIFSLSFHFLFAGLIFMPAAKAVTSITRAPFIQYSQLPIGVRQAFSDVVQHVQFRSSGQGIQKAIAGALEIRAKLNQKARGELALNMLNFGGEVVGVENGAQYYFHKSIRDLTTEQAVTLSALYLSFRP
jgi:membrane carboxypeptidase/penicillin-binding protein